MVTFFGDIFFLYDMDSFFFSLLKMQILCLVGSTRRTQSGGQSYQKMVQGGAFSTFWFRGGAGSRGKTSSSNGGDEF